MKAIDVLALLSVKAAVFLCILLALAAPVQARDEIRIYPGENGQFSLCDDDGFTQKYKTRVGERINFTWQDKTRKLRITRKSSSGTKKQTALLVRLIGSDVQRKVSLQESELELELK